MLPDMQHAMRHRNRPSRKQNISIFNVLNVQVMVHNLEKDNLFEMQQCFFAILFIEKENPHVYCRY